MSESDEHLCRLCDRPLGSPRLTSKHHLVPMSKGGKKGKTVELHNICHRKIHAALTNGEIAKNYTTIEQLQKHEEIQKFILWVSKKQPEFYDRSRDSLARKSKLDWKRRAH